MRIKRMKDIYNSLDGFVERKNIVSDKSRASTHKAVSDLLKNKYLYSYRSIVHKAPCNGDPNFDEVNPYYGNNELKYTIDKLSLVTPTSDKNIRTGVSIPEWCYIAKRDGIEVVTVQYICEIVDNFSSYVGRVMRSMAKIGLLTPVDKHSYQINNVDPTLMVTEIRDMAISADRTRPLAKKKKEEEYNPKYKNYAKRVELTEDDYKEATRLADWMNPSSHNEAVWMAKIFLKAIDWGKNS